MKIKPLDFDVKTKMLFLKLTVGLLTSAVIGTIVKEEMKVLDEAEEKMIEKKRHKKQKETDI